MKDNKRPNAFDRKIAELEAAENVVNHCLDTAKWWCDTDENGNITFCDARHEAMYNAFINLAEKLTKEYTK